MHRRLPRSRVAQPESLSLVRTHSTTRLQNSSEASVFHSRRLKVSQTECELPLTLARQLFHTNHPCQPSGALHSGRKSSDSERRKTCNTQGFQKAPPRTHCFC